MTFSLSEIQQRSSSTLSPKVSIDSGTMMTLAQIGLGLAGFVLIVAGFSMMIEENLASILVEKIPLGDAGTLIVGGEGNVDRYFNGLVAALFGVSAVYGALILKK